MAMRSCVVLDVGSCGADFAKSSNDCLIFLQQSRFWILGDPRPSAFRDSNHLSAQAKTLAVLYVSLPEA